MKSDEGFRKYMSLEQFVDFQLSFGLEGKSVHNKEEYINPNGTMRLEILIVLGDYDDVRPSTVFFTDINGNISKGYLGWRN